jgi:hypothetical protein
VSAVVGPWLTEIASAFEESQSNTSSARDPDVFGNCSGLRVASSLKGGAICERPVGWPQGSGEVTFSAGAVTFSAGIDLMANRAAMPAAFFLLSGPLTETW